MQYRTFVHSFHICEFCGGAAASGFTCRSRIHLLKIFNGPPEQQQIILETSDHVAVQLACISIPPINILEGSVLVLFEFQQGKTEKMQNSAPAVASFASS